MAFIPFRVISSGSPGPAPTIYKEASWVFFITINLYVIIRKFIPDNYEIWPIITYNYLLFVQDILKSFAMKRVIVIGNGMVGYKFCEKLRNRTTEFEIIVYGEEPRPAYDRVHLSAYFSGSTAEDLLMAPAAWYVENNIQLHVGEL